MGIISSNKQVNVTQLSCDGTARVSLALTAAPDILQNPADIVLVLDRSGSMAGAPLASMKDGAKTFIDILSEATPEFERVMLEAALAFTSNHKQEAARLLGWGRNTLTRKIKELHLSN